MSSRPNIVCPKLAELRKYIDNCRDFYDGAVKVLNEKYLPKMDRETIPGYNIRIKSTAFTNLYSPVVTGLTGLITKKEPVIDGYEAFPLDDVDGKGTNLPTFIKNIVTSSIVAGVEFVSVETSTTDNKTFFKRYTYEQLVSYQIDELQRPTQLVFEEKLEENDGAFGIKNIVRYVVFHIGGGEVWYDSGNGQGIAKQDEWKNKLTTIPVVALVTGKVISPYEIIPRFYDIAQLNQVMLNVETQLANVLTVVGNPIPVFYGDADEGTITIGVKDAMMFEDRQKEGLEYVEVTGNGITKLQEKIKEIELAIDKTSFSVLNREDNNTIIDAQDNQNKSGSFLSDTSEELECKINRLFGFYSELSGVALPPEIIVFKKDFDTAMITDKQLEMLLKMLEGGNISRETLWQKLKVAGVLPKDFDAEIEMGQLDTMVV